MKRLKVDIEVNKENLETLTNELVRNILIISMKENSPIWSLRLMIQALVAVYVGYSVQYKEHSGERLELLLKWIACEIEEKEFVAKKLYEKIKSNPAPEP